MDFPLAEETVEVRGHSFTVRELTMDQLLPLTTGDMPDEERSMRIMGASVTYKGKPVNAGGLPASIFTHLSEAVSRINGLSEEDDGPPGNA